MIKSLKIIVSGRTSIGKVKESNEDSYGIFEDLNLYIIADGMGGHRGGDIASKIAVETTKEIYISYLENDQLPLESKGDLDINARRLISSIESANLKIFNTAMEKHKLKGMGTTIAAVLIDPDLSLAYISHVGDSRVYSIAGDQINQITVDHSLVNEYLRKGWIEEDEVEHHPLKNMLIRALGTEKETEIDLVSREIKDGDIFLLCSDGLSSMITNQDMLDTITDESGSFEEKNQRLIDMANERGGIDNITAIIIKCSTS